MTGDNPAKITFKPSPHDDLHVDLVTVRTAEGTLDLCVAIDCPGKSADAELHAEANYKVAAQCLHHLVAAVPDKSHRV
jgi:hypothetical protein